MLCGKKLHRANKGAIHEGIKVMHCCHDEGVESKAKLIVVNFSIPITYLNIAYYTYDRIITKTQMNQPSPD